MSAVPVVLGDWGSTRLRLWLREAGVTRAAAEAPGLLAANEAPRDVLDEALDQLGPAALGCPVLLCGMAGARAGLAEVGYVACPGGVGQWVAAARTHSFSGRTVRILPGFSDRDAHGRPDVMRGEEAQVFGTLGQAAGEAHAMTIVLPGTHSKWVRLEQGRIARFATAPTGELHARLLGSSMAPVAPDTRSPAYGEGFAAGLERVRSGIALMRALFEARAGSILDARTPDWSAGFLSGLLIGSELAGMSEDGEFDGPALLIGAPALLSLYHAAFAEFGRQCHTAEGDSCALAGLEMAHALLG